MCFHTQQTKTTQQLEQRFEAKVEHPELFQPGVYNGFDFPKTPVITHTAPEKIQALQWGLIPFWAQDDSIKKYTLNARIETIDKKPAFRDAVRNRCMIMADGFFEWHWLDKKGKQKQKYLLTLPNEEPFAFAGLWSEWIDRHTGEVINSYAILTTPANELMSKIHNIKQRMPVILDRNHETDWLQGSNLIMQNDRLIAGAV